MLSNHITVAIRNLLRQRLYSLINVTGLAVGVSACVIVLLFFQHEFSYDTQFKDVDRIYRVLRATNVPGQERYLPDGLQGPAGPSMVEVVPGLVSSTRFMKRPMWAGFEDHGFDVAGAVADPNILDFFGIPVLKGEGPEALKRPDAVFVTASFAKKLFGNEDPVGRRLLTDWKWLKGGNPLPDGILPRSRAIDHVASGGPRRTMRIDDVKMED